MSERYPEEVLDSEEQDDGTMPESRDRLAEAIVGHRIVAVDDAVPDDQHNAWVSQQTGVTLTLDSGQRVIVRDTDDCCAYTEIGRVVRHLDQMDHVITGVGTTDGFTRWHIYADLGDVLELEVGWSCGNPFYYGYGFSIEVLDPPTTPRPHEPEPETSGEA